jgi:aminocarboxymuconate-semialdehyde decarboxylase
VFDIHAHHYPTAYLEACRRSDSGMTSYVRDDGRLVVLQDGAVALAAPQPMPTLEHRLHMMDEVGVRQQVLSISAPNVYRFPGNWRASLTAAMNDELADLHAQSNSRLAHLVSLPLPDVDAALSELDRAMAAPGAIGVFLTTTIDHRPLDAQEFAPLLAELDRRGAIVFVHPTTGCTENVTDYALSLALDYMGATTTCLGRLVYSGTLERYPRIRWIFAHLGGTTPFVLHRFDNYYMQFPECREKITKKPSELLADVYFDTVTTNVAAVACTLANFSGRQLLFGTDYPHVPGGLAAFVDTVKAATPDETIRSMIFQGNAERLIGHGNA